MRNTLLTIMLKDDGGYLCKDQPEATKALFVNTTLGAELGFQAGQINGKKPVDVNIAVRFPHYTPFDHQIPPRLSIL